MYYLSVCCYVDMYAPVHIYVDARAMPKDIVRGGALVLKVNLFYMN